MTRKKVSDQTIIDSYMKCGSVWKTAKDVGLCGQSVHERLTKIGLINKLRVFTEKEKQRLLNDYTRYRDLGELNILAANMGRTKQFICRKAKELGLTDKNAEKPYLHSRKSYNRNHNKVRKLRGSPKFCEICQKKGGKTWYEWANLTGDYDNPKDYKRMCRKCHRYYDKGRARLDHLK